MINNILDTVKLNFSAYNERKQDFEKILPEKSLDDLTDDDLLHITDTATSASCFVDNETDIPKVMDYMKEIYQMLEWKGDVKPSPSQYKHKKTKETIHGFVVSMSREPSRKIGLVSLKDRLAGISR
jgi:hypothetical protein